MLVILLPGLWKLLNYFITLMLIFINKSAGILANDEWNISERLQYVLAV